MHILFLYFISFNIFIVNCGDPASLLNFLCQNASMTVVKIAVVSVLLQRRRFLSFKQKCSKKFLACLIALHGLLKHNHIPFYLVTGSLCLRQKLFKFLLLGPFMVFFFLIVVQVFFSLLNYS